MLLDRVREHLAHAAYGVYGLGDDGAGDASGKGCRYSLSDRDYSVFENMVIKDLSLVETFSFCEFNVVLAHLVHYVPSGPQHQAGNGRKSKGYGRKYPRPDIRSAVSGEHVGQVESRCRKVSEQVQEKVKQAINTMTGLDVKNVNIRIAGVRQDTDK